MTEDSTLNSTGALLLEMRDAAVFYLRSLLSNKKVSAATTRGCCIGIHGAERKAATRFESGAVHHARWMTKVTYRFACPSLNFDILTKQLFSLYTDI